MILEEIIAPLCKTQDETREARCNCRFFHSSARRGERTSLRRTERE